eukprot:766639-Hanusia_phi.AAC.6
MGRPVAARCTESRGTQRTCCLVQDCRGDSHDQRTWSSSKYNRMHILAQTYSSPRRVRPSGGSPHV